MSVAESLTAALLILGVFFYVAGTVGLLRFPDVYCRLHALTKVDNLGLGLLTAGLLLQSDTVSGALKLILIWVLAIAASATAAYLAANAARRHGVELRSGREPRRTE